MSFDLFGPLPTGTTVLEASAGTGKTYTLAALATRYVAEGVAELSELMLVTFGRAATQELRERTRDRLTQTARALAHPGASDDPLVRHLTVVGAEQCRRRLLRALSDFDAATIATTHSFCQRMLEELGIAGDSQEDANLVESVEDLVTEVVDDLYLAMFAGHTEAVEQITVREALEASRAAVADRQARLQPQGADLGSVAGQRVTIAAQARIEVERRKRARAIRDYDDLLVLLRDSLADSEQACARVRARYRVVLVDEFQDTDPVQWEVLRRAFHGHITLILIGDPKQAVYAFRGAEVLSYLEAVRVADVHETLPCNYRTDPGLLSALAHLYGGAALGHPAIVVHPVQAFLQRSRMPGHCPLRLKVVRRTPPLGKNGFPQVSVLRRLIATDLADDIVRLLRTGDAVPADLAVLVRTRAQSEIVRAALERCAVPVVLAGSSSVFATQAATDWLRVLQALEQPHRVSRVRLACLTSLLGWTVTELAQAAEEPLADLAVRLREWAVLLEEAGFAAFVERMTDQTRLQSRLLAEVGGERSLTDLRHLAQSLNRAAVEQGLGLSALTNWLSERVTDPDVSGDRSRRLESDAAAVQVVTVHASKGLEFPVVYLPYGWDAAKNPQQSTLLLHDEDGTRVLDIGGKTGPGYRTREQQSHREEAGEELRLLYVALTRAQSQVIAWWAPGASTSKAPLQRLLMGRDGSPAPAPVAKVPQDEAVMTRLATWALHADGVIDVETVSDPQRLTWTREGDEPAVLAAARFDRWLDPDWRRTSYSALTAAAHSQQDLGVSSEVEEPEKTDEPAGEPSAGFNATGPASTLNAFAGGAAFGTLVHQILEQLDTEAPDLPAELLSSCRIAVTRRLATVDPEALAVALLPVLHTPLGFGTLASISGANRLSELDFELPLGGGDDPGHQAVTLQQIADLLRERLPSDDVLAPYADRLHTLGSRPLRGYLSGSIDAVLRTPKAWVVVDYKTNRLARGELTALHYTRELMAQEMLESHYVLQALLYAVALHRYLRWRLPGQSPRILVQYHFVRGMVGAATPVGCGVFDWEPPEGLIEALSDVLGGSR